MNAALGDSKNVTTRRADLLILVAMAMFGSYSLFLRLFPELSVYAFLIAFQLVGAVVFFQAARKSQFRISFNRRGWLLVSLAVVAIGNDLAYFAAIRETSVANATIAHQAVSMFLLILAPLLLKERTGRDEWLAFVPSVIGVVVLYSQDINGLSSDDFLGITLGLVSGLFYALLIILYRIIPNEAAGLNTNVINCWRYVFSSILLLPVIPFMNVGKIHPTDFLALIGFGIFFAVLASGIHTFAISKTRSLHASLIGKIEPVFAIIYAFIFLGETPSVQAILGGILIIGASVWLITRQEQLGGPQKTQEPMQASGSISSEAKPQIETQIPASTQDSEAALS